MENKERISGVGYFLFNLMAFVAFYVFGLFFYTTELARGTLDYSSKYLIVALATFTILFITLCIINGKKCRNIFGMLMNISVPLAILNVVVLIKRAGSIGIWCAIISLALVAIFWLFVWLEDKMPKNAFFEKLIVLLYGKENENSEESSDNMICEETTEYEVSVPKRIYSSVIAFFIILAVMTTLVMGCLGVFQTHYNSYHDHDVSYHEKYIPNEDMREYSKIESKYWKSLDIDSRLEVLQKFAEQEAVRLGLPEVPSVVTAELYNKYYDVNYNAEENLIELDLNMVKYNKSGYKAVKALANGSYYAYEDAKKQLVEAINSDEATSKYSELTMFWDTNVNNQFVFEENARRYSEFVQSEFRRKIMLFKFDNKKEYY